MVKSCLTDDVQTEVPLYGRASSPGYVRPFVASRCRLSTIRTAQASETMRCRLRAASESAFMQTPGAQLYPVFVPAQHFDALLAKTKAALSCHDDFSVSCTYYVRVSIPRHLSTGFSIAEGPEDVGQLRRMATHAYSTGEKECDRFIYSSGVLMNCVDGRRRIRNPDWDDFQLVCALFSFCHILQPLSQ